MYTETELRDMLQASADRVPAIGTVPPDVRGPNSVQISDAHPPTPNQLHRRSRRVVAPVAVAAATVVLAGVVTVFAHHERGADKRQAARSSAPVAIAPNTDTTDSGTPVVRRSHQALTPVLDVVTVDRSGAIKNYLEPVGDDKHGAQVVHSRLSGDRTMTLTIAPAGAFDDAKVSTAHPVSIAGTTGHYAVLRLYPISANGQGGSNPAGTIVFRTPDRHWAFATLQAGTKNDTVEGVPVNDPAAILAGYERLKVSFTAGRYRTPLRLNYLPAHARFSAAGDATDSDSSLTFASLTTQDDDKQMDVTLVQGTGGWKDGEDCTIIPAGCATRYHRTLPDGRTLVVDGIGYSLAETKKVIDGVQLAGDITDRSTYFTLADAVG